MEAGLSITSGGANLRRRDTQAARWPGVTFLRNLKRHAIWDISGSTMFEGIKRHDALEGICS